MFWPFPSAYQNYPKYVFEYSCEALQQILQNDEIFRLINDNSSNNRVDTLFKHFPDNQNLETELRYLLRNNLGSFIELSNYVRIFLCEIS
jgi:hypothetical protein